MSYEQAPQGRIVGHVGESVMVYFDYAKLVLFSDLDHFLILCFGIS